MEKEFAPYNLSLRMKALEFAEPCLACYTENAIGRGDKLQFFVKPIKCNDDYVFVSAPTFSQAFRWFREKHGLQGYVYSTTVRGGKEGKHFSDYCWHINGMYMPFLSIDARDMENVSYEEAELSCLTKLIEIVETRTK